MFEIELRMEASLEHLSKLFDTLRTSGANTSVLDCVRVNCYDTEVELRSVAAIIAPDKRNLIVRPFDVGILPNIEKALLKSKVGLTPLREGTIIRLPVPPLTEERRIELTKRAGEIAEGQRVAIRNIRRDALREFLDPSQDQKRTFAEDLDNLTKTYVLKIDETLKFKNDALLDVDNRWNIDPKGRKR